MRRGSFSADGGEPVVLTRPDRAHGEADHLWPELLPGGQAVLCTVTATTGGLDAASIAVFDLRSGRLTILVRGGSHAQHVASGHLVFAVAGTLHAVGFDTARSIIIGTARPVVRQVLTTPMGAVDAVMARDGTLAYVSEGTRSGLETLVWVDRTMTIEDGWTCPTSTDYTRQVCPNPVLTSLNWPGKAPSIATPN
jgi:hypothetical protein